ncbi:MAG: DUF2189 domain-containing protein [Rhodospirillales bacterium]|nr:DUF2189 domain-containing protein [Rhodospirillales bacterium]
MAENEAPAGQSAARGNVLPYADRINTVRSDEPFKWLAAGWRDFRRSGLVSLAYGLIFVAAGVALTIGLYAADFAYLIAPLIGGFLLVGPALTVGFYTISRDLEAGRKPSLARALTAWRANPVHLLGFGLAQVLFMIIWVRLAVMIFALSFPYQSMDLQSMVNAALFSVQGNLFLMIGTLVGSVMATLAFTFSVVSLPLMLDRKADIVQAVVISVVAVITNIRVMVVWAALIVVFTIAGLATFYIGLAVTLPLIGHASWHAYRALIR